MTLQAVVLDSLSRISANKVEAFSQISKLGFIFIIRSTEQFGHLVLEQCPH